jgi:glycosyltransferase involved in cell wall biosynthesis
MKDPPLRFCMISTFYPPYSFGGDGNFVHHLSEGLARRGHHVEVIHCLDSYRLLAGSEPTGTYQDVPGVIVHGLRSPWGPLSPLATQQTGYPLFKLAQIRRILDHGFDVIHYHNPSLVGGPGILKFGRAIKLYTMHEYWLVCPTHVLFRFNRQACTRRNCFLCQIAHNRPPQLWRYSGLLKRMAAHVDAFISPSRYTMDKHRALGFDREIVHLPSFAPEALGLSSSLPTIQRADLSEPYFLFAGRLERLKGLQTLIPVFLNFEKAQLMIAGSGGYESELRKMAQGCTRIRFLGQQSAEQVRALLLRAAALIVPSIVFEVFPNVTLEAFCQGTPAIVRNIGGLPEAVEQSGGGFVYSTDEELISAMQALLADPAYRDDLGRRGYQAYRERWTADAHLQAYLGLIRNLSESRA